MDEQSWNKIYTPPPHGWSRLSAKIALTDDQRFQEIRIWRTVAAAMIVITVMLSLQDPPGAKTFMSALSLPQSGEVLLNEGHAHQVPGAPAGVRFFWIFPDAGKSNRAQ